MINLGKIGESSKIVLEQLKIQKSNDRIFRLAIVVKIETKTIWSKTQRVNSTFYLDCDYWLLSMKVVHSLASRNHNTTQIIIHSKIWEISSISRISIPITLTIKKINTIRWIRIEYVRYVEFDNHLNVTT